MAVDSPSRRESASVPVVVGYASMSAALLLGRSVDEVEVLRARARGSLSQHCNTVAPFVS